MSQATGALEPIPCPGCHYNLCGVLPRDRVRAVQCPECGAEWTYPELVDAIRTEAPVRLSREMLLRLLLAGLYAIVIVGLAEMTSGLALMMLTVLPAYFAVWLFRMAEDRTLLMRLALAAPGSVVWTMLAFSAAFMIWIVLALGLSLVDVLWPF